MKNGHNPPSFAKWLRLAHKGDATVYYRGLLLRERVEYYDGQGRRIKPLADFMAERAWEAYKKGLVHLVQRKVEEGIYEYIAIHR